MKVDGVGVEKKARNGESRTDTLVGLKIWILESGIYLELGRGEGRQG